MHLRHVTGEASRLREEVQCSHSRTSRFRAPCHGCTLLDLRGNIPRFIHISDGKLGNVKALDILVLEPGAIYVMDRGYLDFARLYTMHQAQAFSVTRAKSNTRLRHVYSAAVDRSTGIICDQTVAFAGISIFVERLWHSVKHEDVYLKDYATIGESMIGLTRYFIFYNGERPHQSLGNSTPNIVYRTGLAACRT